MLSAHFCIKGVSIFIAPLRERREDIPYRVEFVIDKSFNYGQLRNTRQCTACDSAGNPAAPGHDLLLPVGKSI